MFKLFVFGDNFDVQTTTYVTIFIYMYVILWQ